LLFLHTPRQLRAVLDFFHHCISACFAHAGQLSQRGAGKLAVGRHVGSRQHGHIHQFKEFL